MSNGKTTISQASTYEQIGEFWDTHDTMDYWDQTQPAEFEVDLQTRTTYFALDRTLAARLDQLAQQRGVSVETLMHILLLERLQELQKPEAA